MSTLPYQAFIDRKRRRTADAGMDVPADSLHPALYPFQRHVVSWALRKGRAALFEDCGLGKTIQQLEWARWVHRHTGKPVLIFAPLAVGQQTAKEGGKIDLPVTVARTGRDVTEATTVAVTNYEMMRHFDPSLFGGLVLDEGSIIKDRFGKMRSALIEFASAIPYRLSATATPAPNDLMELINQACYLGLTTFLETAAMFFTNDTGSTQDWRIKKHAVSEFWQWVGSWAVAIRSPADIGFSDDGFNLPELRRHIHVLDDSDKVPDGELFAVAVTLNDQRRARRASLDERCQLVADMVNGSAEPWVVWCEMNDESSLLSKLIPEAVEVRGSDDRADKAAALIGFTEGKHRVIVTKPSIAGHGLNWQHVAKVAFVGISHSYEQFYQAVRRVWRYGQHRPVDVHIVSNESCQSILDNVQQKEEGAMQLYDSIIHQMQPGQRERVDEEYHEKYDENWKLMLGDSVDTIDHIADHSVGMSVFSPPFPGMYIYTDSPADMGNVSDIGDMIEQFSYLMAPDKMRRVIMPGRSVFIHITQGVAQAGRDGYIGLRDFRGPIIAMMQTHGWIYYGEVTIDKNPQVKAVRTKDSGLMFKSLANDAARMHPALSDQLLQFRAPGDNPSPIRAGSSERYGNAEGWVTSEDWILWARPVWYAADYQPGSPGLTCPTGIAETDVLNVAMARSEEDERHLCPLQLGVIRRCVRVWSNPGETVYSPFAGVGSEGVVALQEGRRFIGGELKRSYFDVACNNLRDEADQRLLFAEEAGA